MWLEIITIVLPALTGLIGWLVGRRKQNNDFIHELQSTINMLVDENTKLLKEIIVVKNQNAKLLCEMESVRFENEKLLTQLEILRRENAEFKAQLKEFTNKK